MVLLDVTAPWNNRFPLELASCTLTCVIVPQLLVAAGKVIVASVAQLPPDAAAKLAD
jgi:hypothetical protein